MEMESINQEVNLNSESTARAPSSWHQKSCAPRFRQENPPLPMNLYTTWNHILVIIFMFKFSGLLSQVLTFNGFLVKLSVSKLSHNDFVEL